MRRRQFFAAPLALAAGTPLRGDDEARALEVTDPGAISGDPVEPKWETGNVVTVGPHKADMVGSDQKAIQAAVDYAARLGGGTVRILPGTYRMRNAVISAVARSHRRQWPRFCPPQGAVRQNKTGRRL
jgi:hypothetical protein